MCVSVREEKRYIDREREREREWERERERGERERECLPNIFKEVKSVLRHKICLNILFLLLCRKKTVVKCKMFLSKECNFMFAIQNTLFCVPLLLYWLSFKMPCFSLQMFIAARNHSIIWINRNVIFLLVRYKI